jgi:hypothetical protein
VIIEGELLMRHIDLNLKRLLREQCGAVLILWAVLLPVVVGMIALGVDTGTWYLKKRDLQSVADAAAIAGAYESVYSDKVTVANNEVTRNGFGSGSNVTTVVNSAPATGPYASNTSAVEVLLSQPQTLFFSTMNLDENPPLTVRAVALRQPAGEACVLALDNSVQYALQFQGNSTVSMPNCIAASNSNADISAIVSGSSVLNAETLYTVGGYDVRGHAELNTSSTPITGGSQIQDPYADLPMPNSPLGIFYTPMHSNCDYNNYSTNGTVTLNPGIYCNGLRLTSHADVTLTTGVYIIDRGTFDIGAQSTIRTATGAGVTILLTSSTGSGYATISINGGATVNLAAQTSGVYSGILFYQDRRAAPSGSGNCGNQVNCLNGGANMNLTGVIYIPNQTVSYIGGAASGGSTCTQIVGRVVQFNGNTDSHIDNSGCEAAGVTNISVPGPVKLVE